MFLSDDTYVPAVRWRQGEYQALLRLSSSVKERIVPLITIPAVEFDFELWQPKKTVHEHVHPFLARYQAKWGKRLAWIGLDSTIAAARMNDGRHVFDYVFDGLRPGASLAIPALPLASDATTVTSVARAASQDGRGAALIMRIEDLMTGNPLRAYTNFAATLGIELDELDIIIDLRSPNFEPYGVFANALIAALRRLGDLSKVRTLVLLATAIPDSFAGLAQGTDEIPRHDWLFFKAFLSALPSGMRRPLYGDHTIVHPDFKAVDMRKVKAAGKIIYTTPETWATRKGGAFISNPAQMHDHCARVVVEPAFAFRGPGYSYGDRYIADCAIRAEQPSNLSRWKDVAINHHITTVADDLATLLGTS